MRICGEATNFDVDFNNGDDGCPIAVLSRCICAKARPKARKRHTVFSICKTSVGEKGAKIAGQASMRVRRRVMDSGVILHKGTAGCPIAVL